MNKKLIRITESDLHRIVKQSVNRILREDYGNNEISLNISYFDGNDLNNVRYVNSLYKSIRNGESKNITVDCGRFGYIMFSFMTDKNGICNFRVVPTIHGCKKNFSSVNNKYPVNDALNIMNNYINSILMELNSLNI